jgi:large subunit ribosomal protein L6
MSRIGKQPVKILEGVIAKESGREIKITGPKGTLSLEIPGTVTVEIKDDTILVTSKKETKQARANFGTIRSLIANIVDGVSKGWSKQLELVGTGYRAEVQDKNLLLTVGFSHPVKIEPPEGVTFKVEKTIVTVEGANKETVGQVAANIRAVRPPEPYKGKGIKYVDEVIRRKAGKAAKTVGSPA